MSSPEPSLPSSIHTDVADESNSDVSLPPSIGSDDLNLDDGCNKNDCCKRNCGQFFSKEALQSYQLELGQGTPAEVKARKFDCVKKVFDQNTAEKQKNGLDWHFQGHTVCRRFWTSTHALSPGKVSNILKLLRAGNVTLPPPGPRAHKPEPMLDRCNTWLLETYQHLADPLAVPGSEDRLPTGLAEVVESTHEIVDDISHPVYALGFNLDTSAGGKRVAGRRFLNFHNIHELFTFYQADVDSSQQVARSTFERAFKAWSKYLIFKSPSQGNKCSICLSLAERRSNASNEEERLQIDCEKQEHLNVVKKDRKVNTRGNVKSSELANFMPDNRHHGVCKLMLDGMDQAKFAMPRAKRLCGTSDYGKVWKPNVHLVGGILWGVCEYYYLLPMDCAKDSSMQATLLGRSLDVAREKLQLLEPTMDLDLPDNMVIAVDNTPRESKNQIFAGFCAWLTAHHFRCVETQYLQTQHTHNELDQRFSTLATLIKQCPKIETMDELKHIIESQMKPLHAKYLHVEIVHNTWDFKAWMQGSSDSNISGLTSTQFSPANHLWRFERREAVQGDHPRVEIFHEDWNQLEENPGDVVLTVKQFISDAAASQPPQLILPLSVWNKFDKAQLKPSVKNPFSQTTLSEFRKTAKLVGSAPWNLFEGQTWLEELCDNNENGVVPKPVELKFIFSIHDSEARIAQQDPPNFEDVEMPQQAPPRHVTVKQQKVAIKRPATHAPVRMVRRRPAAAITEGPTTAPMEGELAEEPAPPPNAPADLATSSEIEPEVTPGPVLRKPATKMRKPAAASALTDRSPAPVDEPTSIEAIKALPNFLHWGCAKCRKSFDQPKTGCGECKRKAERRYSGFRSCPDGFVYRLHIEDVD